MRRTEPGVFAALALVFLTTACATATRQHAAEPVSSPTLTVVAGTALLDPAQAPAVIAEALALEPEHAAAITASAVTAAPAHAASIARAARRSAPGHAAEIDAAAKLALQHRAPSAQVRIPDHVALERFVERATSESVR